MVAPVSTKPPKPKPNRTGVALSIYIPPALADRLEQYLDARQPDAPKKTTVVVAALNEFLTAKGFPPIES